MNDAPRPESGYKESAEAEMGVSNDRALLRFDRRIGGATGYGPFDHPVRSALLPTRRDQKRAAQFYPALRRSLGIQAIRTDWHSDEAMVKAEDIYGSERGALGSSALSAPHVIQSAGKNGDPGRLIRRTEGSMKLRVHAVTDARGVRSASS